VLLCGFILLRVFSYAAGGDDLRGAGPTYYYLTQPGGGGLGPAGGGGRFAGGP
jgi:hypothetical protein